MLRRLCVLGFLLVSMFALGCGRGQGPEVAGTPGVSPAAGTPGETASPNGHGVVEAISSDRTRVTLRHGAIPAVRMTAMTMEFRVREPAVLEGITVGDEADFLVVREPSEELVVVQVRKSTGGMPMSPGSMPMSPGSMPVSPGSMPMSPGSMPMSPGSR